MNMPIEESLAVQVKFSSDDCDDWWRSRRTRRIKKVHQRAKEAIYYVQGMKLHFVLFFTISQEPVHLAPSSSFHFINKIG